jgi:endonuclease YncB( thermonuclease family)
MEHAESPRDFLASLEYMVGRAIYYLETDKDRYDRMLATPYRSEEGYNINASLVCAGAPR